MTPDEFDKKVNLICDILEGENLLDVLGILGFILGCLAKIQPRVLRRSVQSTFYKIVDQAVEFDGHNPISVGLRADVTPEELDAELNKGMETQEHPVCPNCGGRHPVVSFDDSKKDVVH